MICEYGCGRKAKYQLKNGKWCCSKSQNSCLEMKRRNSETKKGKNHPMFGKHRAEETKKLLREANLGMKKPWASEMNRKRTGKNNPFHGKKHKEETKQKQRKAKLGKKRPDVSEMNRKRTGPKNHNWIPDREQRFAPYTAKFYDKDYRQFIFETNNNGNEICPICLKKEISELHHINYNKQNDNKKNLIFLCISCHRRTNHNRDYWYKKLKKE